MDTRFGPQINFRTRLGLQQVITFVLGVVHAKVLLNIFGKRMDLEAKILPADGIEKIKTDRKFRAKAGVDFFAQQRARVEQYQILRGDLDPHVAKTQ